MYNERECTTEYVEECKPTTERQCKTVVDKQCTVEQVRFVDILSLSSPFLG